MTLLECSDLSRRFGGVKAIDKVSFRVEEGRIVGLIGPNGAGKTTLFNLVAGALKPDSGRVAFAGADITGLPANEICAQGIARTFQVTRPFASMTCAENVAVAVINSPRYDRGTDWKPVALQCLEWVGLAAFAHTEAKHLNVVQKKKLEIARALASRPKLLMLDEVLGGLNTQEIGQAMDFIRRLRDEHKLTILWIEHVMGAIMRVAEQVIVLDQGKLLVEGPPEAVVSNPAVIQAYLGD